MKECEMQEMMDRGNGHSNAQVAFAPPTSTNQLKVRWAKIKRRIGNGSAPDDSLGEPTNTTDATSDNGSSFGNGRRWGRRSGGGSKNGGEAKDGENEKETIDEVDEVVVEATGSPGSWKAAAGVVSGGSNREGASGTNNGTGMQGTAMQSEGSSLRATAYDNASGILGTAGNFCRYRIWPLVVNFFEPRYHDPVVEEAYQKELWYTHKSLCIFGACFLALSWILSLALLPRPWSLWNKVYNYGIGPLLSLPLIVGAALDLPRKKKWVWQVMVFLCVYMAAIPNIVDMKLCDYWSTTNKNCGNRDFLGTMYAPTAGPVIALFALNQRRIIIFIYLVCWIALIGGLILPTRVKFIRNVINVFIFQLFVMYVHYNLEMGSRRMYTLRAELKVQFRAKQKSQINERRAQDAKRRFSSYIFHEVRVPLNTALLAVQNISADSTFDKTSDMAVEYAALEGSLQMMSQVLNDVLDFSRMERGGFSSVSRPFSLHQVMASIFVPLRIDTNARGLALETELDPRIDEVAKRAAYPEEEGSIVQEGDGVMLGDEMRLRQVINNLASNAAKFTTAGGKITIRTKLIHPLDAAPHFDPSSTETTHSDTTSATASHTPRLSQNRLQQHEATTSPESAKDTVMVARIEVEDTGVGIRSRDMAENRLFSAYAQTSVGLMQGGKGTGLGLSLVRQIVMLSGGRLGVKSKVGVGSCFWIEMPFGIGAEARMSDRAEPHRRVSSTLDKEKDVSTPSTSSEPSDYRFMPSLGKRSSDPTLDSIGELTSADAPAHYRFSSPPSTPALRGPATFINLESPSQTPPLSSTPRLPQSDQSQQPEEGATDLLRRPSVPPKNLSSASAPPALPPPAAKPKSQALEFADGPLRVLVVDDDALTRRLMGRMMQRLGCIVSTAENGAIALNMLLANADQSGASEGGIGVDPRSGNAVKNYDITFLDNQMPVCSGVQVANRMRSLGRDDLLIGVTANALISDQRDYIEQGASAVLTKPVLEVDLRKYLIQADRQRAEARKPQSSRPPSPTAPVFPPPVLIRSRDDED